MKERKDALRNAKTFSGREDRPLAFKSKEEVAKYLTDLSAAQKRADMGDLPEGMAGATKGMRPHEVQRAIDYDARTGLRSEAGFRKELKAKPRAVIASCDGRGTQKTDTAFGQERTNHVIDLVGITMRQMDPGETFLKAKPHGDELFLAHDNEAKLKKFLDDVQAELSNTVPIILNSDGSIVAQEGVHFRYGLGKDLPAADTTGLQGARAVEKPVPEPRLIPEGEVDAYLADLAQRGLKVLNTTDLCRRTCRERGAFKRGFGRAWRRTGC
jgi:hypothetical protein